MHCRPYEHGMIFIRHCHAGLELTTCSVTSVLRFPLGHSDVLSESWAANGFTSSQNRAHDMTEDASLPWICICMASVSLKPQWDVVCQQLYASINWFRLSERSRRKCMVPTETARSEHGQLSDCLLETSLICNRMVLIPLPQPSEIALILINGIPCACS